MYDGGKIILGIIIFVVLFTSPIWTNMLSPDEAKAPDIKLPKGHKECVMDKEYMTAYHMDLLNQWRDNVVRQDIRYYDKDGKPFYLNGKRVEMSLTKTCMNCHDSRADFCDQCHNYLDVHPYCWDCHVDKYVPTTDYKCPEPEKEILPEVQTEIPAVVDSTEEVQQ
jgi:hypothetical protein